MSNRWSKIDEAPKDGTAVLVCCGENQHTAFWNVVEGAWCLWYTDEEYGNRVLLVKPTAWMPLPENPPKVNNGKA